MAKKPNKKKVVVSRKKSDPAKKKISATVSRGRSTTSVTIPKQTLIFGKQNYILMVSGAVLVLFGLLLMVGGSMPDPNTWDPDIIYSKRITLLGPMFILAGLILEIYAIFKK